MRHFSLIRLGRDCLYHILSGLYEVGDLQDIAESEVQSPVWFDLYHNDADRVEAVQNVS